MRCTPQNPSVVVKRLPHVLLVGCAVLALSGGTALAKRRSGPAYVPPSQSAASQYTEDVPTAGGNTPTSGIGGGDGSGGGSSTGIPAKTLHQLDRRGSAGAAAAALARALAPAPTHARPRTTSAGRRSSTARTSASTAQNQTGAPAAQVIKTLGGADAGGGIGVLLPVILGLSLVGATGLGLLRIRRAV